jgi:hypothetical protein
MLKRITLAVCLLGASAASGQWHAEKELHSLNDASSLFVSLVPANAGTSASASGDTSTGNWSEGGASVRFDHSFLAVPGGFVEGFWNDPLVTLDLSFAAYGLSLYAKGSTTDTVRLMLFEDHDMDDDPVEAGDEVFASPEQPLSTSGRHRRGVEPVRHKSGLCRVVHSARDRGLELAQRVVAAEPPCQLAAGRGLVREKQGSQRRFRLPDASQ